MMKTCFTARLPLCLLLLLFCSYPVRSYAQKFKERELEGNILSTDIGEGIAFGLAARSIHWLNPYVGATAALMTHFSKIDEGFNSPKEGNVSYDLDSPILSLNGALGLRFSTPTFKKFGMMSDLNFIFDPIPFNVVSIEKKIYEQDAYRYKDKNKDRVVYTRFNPSFRMDLGLFYDKETRGGRMRLSLGVGITNFNPYNVYYRAKVEGIRLRDHVELRPDRLSYVIFIRLSGD